MYVGVKGFVFLYRVLVQKHHKQNICINVKGSMFFFGGLCTFGIGGLKEGDEATHTQKKVNIYT